MPCYLCAYQSTKRPRTPEPLPQGSPARPHWPLGTCSRCSVLACSEHGTKYIKFLCAICQPGVASGRALGADGSQASTEDAAIALTHQLGERAPAEQHDQVRRAIARVVEAGKVARTRESLREGLQGLGPKDDEGNLVSNLAGLIRTRMGVERGSGDEFVARVQIRHEEGWAERAGGVISLDAISAAVAATFAHGEPRTGPGTVTAVTGALLMAMATADEQGPPLDPRDNPERLASIEVKPAWEVSHPILLDPVIWMILTAYTE